MKQINYGNKNAFTLVELIVVITILAILGTIAFISYQGYSRDSRDSKRISDINSIQKSLGIYIVEKGTYPIPDEFANITYSGGTAWIEGTIGDKVIRNLDKINEKPLDPLTGNEYTYSITASKTEYQIGAISEGGQIGYKLPINQTYAADKKQAKAMIRGTYNERFLKVQSGTLNWILAIPSIIVTDITEPEIQTILNSKKLVYNNYANIPHSYNSYGYTMTGGFNYTNSNPLIYSGSTKNLAEDTNKKIAFVDSLKEAYNGTILQGEPNYQDIVNSDTENNETGAINIINNFINTNVGGIKSGNFILPIIETPQNPIIEPITYCEGTSETCLNSESTSCKYIKDNNLGNTDGVYWIDPDGNGGTNPLKVYCDMTTDGGGWTLVERGKGGDNPAGFKTINDFNSTGAVNLYGGTFKLSDIMINMINNNGNGAFRLQSDGTNLLKRYRKPGCVYSHYGIPNKLCRESYASLARDGKIGNGDDSRWLGCTPNKGGSGLSDWVRGDPNTTFRYDFRADGCTYYYGDSWTIYSTPSTHCYGTSTGCNFNIWVKGM